MNGWQRIEQLMFGVTRPLSLHAFFCACLLLLPLYAVPEAPAAQRARSDVGMDAPPPPLLETLSRPGIWGGLERRVLGAPPQPYRLNPLPRFGQNTPLSAIPAPEFGRPSLALLGQWRLEGG